MAAGVLCVVLALIAVGCFGGEDETPTTTRATSGQSPATTTTTTTEIAVDENAAYSTFRSKDPFIAQAQAGGTTETTEGGSTETTAPSGSGGTSPTTTFRPTTTTGQATSTTQGGTGSTTTTQPAPTTTTTAPHLHTLRILSVAQVGGLASVTFQVDSSIYKDRFIGAVVSTSWGQIKVLDINTSSKVVTLLHGSETLNLIMGQVIYE